MSGQPAGTNLPPATVDYDCLRVPRHLNKQHWSDILSNHATDVTHELVLHRSHNTHVLSKMELPHFIHTYIPLAAAQTDTAADGASCLFYLPRYSLEFELRGDQIVSRDYSGYSLAPSQQLVWKHGDVESCPVEYTLPNFQQYLVLHRRPSGSVVVGSRRSEVLVLVPVGDVTCARDDDADEHVVTTGATVRVVTDRSSSAVQKVRRQGEGVAAVGYMVIRLGFRTQGGVSRSFDLLWKPCFEVKRAVSTCHALLNLCKCTAQ